MNDNEISSEIIAIREPQRIAAEMLSMQKNLIYDSRIYRMAAPVPCDCCGMHDVTTKYRHTGKIISLCEHCNDLRNQCTPRQSCIGDVVSAFARTRLIMPMLRAVAMCTIVKLVTRMRLTKDGYNSGNRCDICFVHPSNVYTSRQVGFTSNIFVCDGCNCVVHDGVTACRRRICLGLAVIAALPDTREIIREMFMDMVV